MTNPLRKAAAEAARPKLTPQETCDEGNQRLARADPPLIGIEWIVREGKALLAWRKTSFAMLQDTARNRVDVMDRRGQRMSESDTFKLNLDLEKAGATARYHPDGTRYFPTT